MDSFEKSILKKKKLVDIDIKRILNDYKLNYSAYIIQNSIRKHLLTKKMMNTANNTKVKAKTQLIEHNINANKPICYHIK